MQIVTTFSEMEIAEYKLHRLLASAAEIGAMNALRKAGVMTKDEISQREAYRRFGEANVKRWIHLRMIKKVKLNERNSKVTYSLQELTSIQSTLYVSTNRKPAKSKNHGTKNPNPNS